MFKRPLRIKNRAAVKKSDRKRVFEVVQHAYPSIPHDLLRNVIFPDSEEIICLKVETTVTTALLGKAKTIQCPSLLYIYCNAKRQPYFVSFDVLVDELTKSVYKTVILPSIYALWLFPSILPLSFATQPEVCVKLQNGADLMLAGASISSSSMEYLATAEFPKEFVYGSISVVCQGFPVGVGKVLMSSEELRRRVAPGGELKGKLLEMVHMIGDELWALGDKSVQPEKTHMNTVMETLLSSGIGNGETSVTPLDTIDEGGASTGPQECDSHGDGDNSEGIMDALFRKILLISLKSRAVEGGLPMLASTLNKHMLAISRRVADQPLDIRKTSYRKFGKFLDAMEQEGLLKVSKVREGVDAVSAVEWKNPEFKDVVAVPDELYENPSASALRIPANIRQVYVVNGKTAPLFLTVNPVFGKGHEFKATDEVREAVSLYIRTRDLVSKTDKNVVNLDKVMVDLLMNKGLKFEGSWPMKWAEILDKLLKEMTINHEVVFTNGAFVPLKGKFVPMDVKVEKRSGNKLVTVIRNLEGLGMDPHAVARELQQHVGATVGVREEGGQANTSHCVTVQGDQTKLLDKFFFQMFEMPKKFVTGLEKPGKKG